MGTKTKNISVSIARKLAAVTGREEAYYQHLCDLLEAIGNDELGLGIKAYQCPKKREDIGFPDIEVLRDGLVIGHIEVKRPEDSLNDKKFNAQFEKYRHSLPNVIFTNIGSWELWQWDNKQEAMKIKKIEWDFERNPTLYEALQQVLELFFTAEPLHTDTPEKLARALARRTKLLASIVFDVYSNESPDNLKMLHETIQDFLINDIDKEQFANMYAETIAYSLFIARLQQQKNEPDKPFDSHYAIKYLNERLPKVPLLHELYSKANAELLEIVRKQIDLIAQELQFCDIEKIEAAFLKHAPDKDPVIYFYEPFLKEIDPVMKKKQGVFYTDKRIADFIVRSVNSLLKSHFDLEDGLADSSVHLLDPAVGTGTFLYSAIQEIYNDILKRFLKSGEAFCLSKMQQIIRNHIIDKFCGFEIRMAPYAIAHLKISLLLEEYGYQFKNSDKNNRLKIYLTNALENERNKLPLAHKIYDSITEETKLADKVKNDDPVMVVLGNPPYSVSSYNKSPWIENLMKDFKEGLNEKNIQPLSDDYIKFIRFAQWMIKEQPPQKGIFAMITNNSFLDGIIHRQMRKSLLESFDEIYILDLHGNSKKKEKAPDGSKDQNVFDIQQGVSISIFVRKAQQKKGLGIVHHAESYGLREEKLESLKRSSIKNIKWQKLDIAPPHYFFVPKDLSGLFEYEHGFKLDDLFPINTSGIKTHNDDELVSFERFKENNHADLYRPFDQRWINYDLKKVVRHRYSVMKHMLHDNFAFLSCRQNSGPDFHHAFVTQILSDVHAVSDQTYIFPLYIYNNDNQKVANMKKEIVDQIENIISKTTPEDIFDYIYAVLHSPFYRKRYREFLKIDFPRIPYPVDKVSFRKLVKLGTALRSLHLLESERSVGFIAKWLVAGTNTIEKVRYNNGKVLINSEQYFGSIPEEVWNFYIGGYQPMQKWLKDRKGRVLTHEDIEHYMQMAVAIKETILLMKEIDPIVKGMIGKPGNAKKTPREREMELKITVYPVRPKTGKNN